VFARKLIRPSGDVTISDILSEAQTIKKLYRIPHMHLIKILGHDWLPLSSDYYVDMELCAYNLEHWIRNNESLYSIDGSIIQRSSYEDLCWASGLMDLLEDGLVIMMRILSGLNYIHECHLVHRDLNPRNGKVFRSLVSQY
jgi:serine/threonine protein kinase